MDEAAAPEASEAEAPEEWSLEWFRSVVGKKVWGTEGKGLWVTAEPSDSHRYLKEAGLIRVSLHMFHGVLGMCSVCTDVQIEKALQLVKILNAGLYCTDIRQYVLMLQSTGVSALCQMADYLLGNFALKPNAFEKAVLEYKIKFGNEEGWLLR